MTRFYARILMSLCIMLNFNSAFAQIAPYSLSPKWMIGRNGGIDFTSGSPVNMAGNPAANGGQEATSTICSPDKNIALYCNNFQVYGVTNGLVNANVNPGAGGQSSTSGSVCFPDPNNTNQYYVFAGNDITGGSSNGINWYLYNKSGTTYTLVSGPNNIATSGQVSESLCVGADGTGGYWVVSHSQGFPYEYYTWHVTTAGVGARSTYTSSARGGGGAGGTLKISKCQTKIALIGSQEVEIRNWNRTTGAVGAVILFSGLGGGPSAGYAGEFSPDGNVLYFAGLSSNLLQQDLTAGSWAPSTIAGATGICGMTLGPDDKIYLQRQVNTLGVINNPNVVGAGCNYSAAGPNISSQGGNSSIGLANIAWLNPNLPTINVLSGTACTQNFSITFQTYFLDNITIDASSVEWDFGDGLGYQTGFGLTPSYDYSLRGGGGSKTIRVRFNDQTCGQQWTATNTANPSCPMPVELINFRGVKYDEKVKLLWTTASELNNDRFVIERSLDGVNFVEIGSVKGGANNNMIKNWEFDDYQFNHGVNYYRLVQYDIDGKATQSNIVMVNYDNQDKVLVYPNPFNNDINVQFLSNEINIQVQVYDVYGRLLKEISGSENLITFGADLSPGCYVLRIYTGSEYQTVEVIKQ